VHVARVARTYTRARGAHRTEPTLRGFEANDRAVAGGAVRGHDQPGRRSGVGIAHKSAVAVEADRERARRGGANPRGERQPSADGPLTDECRSQHGVHAERDRRRSRDRRPGLVRAGRADAPETQPEAAVGFGERRGHVASAHVQRHRLGGERRHDSAPKDGGLPVAALGRRQQRDRYRTHRDARLRRLAVGGGRGHRHGPQPGSVGRACGRAFRRLAVAELPVV
jgi:hypothetical protein